MSSAPAGSSSPAGHIAGDPRLLGELWAGTECAPLPEWVSAASLQHSTGRCSAAVPLPIAIEKISPKE